MKLKVVKNSKKVCATVAGRLLRDYRIGLGLPAVAVAPMADMTYQEWCRTETGNNAKRAARLMQILVDAESTPGKIDKLKREYAQAQAQPRPEPSGPLFRKARTDGKPGRRLSLFVAFAELDALNLRLSNLEESLGVEHASE